MLVLTLIAALVLGFVVAILPHVVWLLAWMVGGCTLHVRVNCPAEITHITLRKK